MWRSKFRNVFHKAQQSSSCHQRYRQILKALYREVDLEDFEIEFMHCLEIILAQDALHRNLYADKSLEFAATFVTDLMESQKDEPNSLKGSDEGDVETHPFLNCVIQNVLINHNNNNVSVRYRTCQFINVILSNIGEDTHIANYLWNIILDSLLERIQDGKPIVRIQAIRAISRLQSPGDPDCPVIQAFLERIYDCTPMVRKEIVTVIAPTPATSPKIIERCRDADHGVRIAAYRKCARMGPKLVKLVDRQSVITNGFSEMHDSVKTSFFNETLPKWLSAYNGDYLKLFEALKVDAYAEDIKQSEVACRNVLELFLKNNQIATIIEYLPINEDKVIPSEKLNWGSALYWHIIVNYLRRLDDGEDYLDNVIPELLPFCVYMESVIKEYSGIMDGWKYTESRQTLQQLLLIVGDSDLGDEAGRRALRALIINTLSNVRLEDYNILHMVTILAKLNPVLDSLTIDICSIISDIREPVVQQKQQQGPSQQKHPPSTQDTIQNNFKIARLKVQIDELKDQCENAVQNSNYMQAAEIKKELIKFHEQLAELTNPVEIVVEAPAKRDDSEILCRCLDILIGILSYPELKTLTVALRSCKDEFIMPLRDNKDPLIGCKVYKCIALCSLLDEQLAKENLKMLCYPINMYRVTPADIHLKAILLISVACVTDIITLYSTDIFSNDNDGSENGEISSLRSRGNGTRRLYRDDGDIDELSNSDSTVVSWRDMVDIILDMLDDQSSDIKETACKAVCRMVLQKIAVSSELLARLILKWLNPITEKHDPNIQLLLGDTFVKFTHLEGTEEIIEKTVLPVLTLLGNAPVQSPLVDVDVDNAVRFLGAISSIRKQPEIIHTHTNLAFSLCSKIANRTNDKCVPIYTKMLLNLELLLDDPVVIKELINQIALILEEVTDKVSKRNLQKVLHNWHQLLMNYQNDAANKENARELAGQNNENEGDSNELVNNKNLNDQFFYPCYVRLTQMLSKKSLFAYPMRTFFEDKFSDIPNKQARARLLRSIAEKDENEKRNLSADDWTIETPSTDVSCNSRTSLEVLSRRPHAVVISETSSDSDEQNGCSYNRNKKQKGLNPIICNQNAKVVRENTLNIVKSVSQDNRMKNELNKKTSLLKMKINEPSSVKRRKKRQKESIEAAETNTTLDETILRTILEDDDFQISLLRDQSTMQHLSATDSSINTRSSTDSLRRTSSKFSKNTQLLTDTSVDSDFSQKKIRQARPQRLVKTTFESVSSQKSVERKAARKKKKQK